MHSILNVVQCTQCSHWYSMVTGLNQVIKLRRSLLRNAPADQSNIPTYINQAWIVTRRHLVSVQWNDWLMIIMIIWWAGYHKSKHILKFAKSKVCMYLWNPEWAMNNLDTMWHALRGWTLNKRVQWTVFIKPLFDAHCLLNCSMHNLATVWHPALSRGRASVCCASNQLYLCYP